MPAVAPRPSPRERATKTSPVAKRVLDGDMRALARLISDVEEGRPEAREVLRTLYPHTGNAPIVGISGPLGVGKSSLINQLLQHLRGKGKTVGVIAVDPSSPFSGGAVLGDRIRIERDPDDTGVFFRSMASRGHAGGVAQSTRDALRLLEAFGMDVLLVETVGSGQVDVEIHDIATTRVVVVVPHLGDEVQTLKAGLFEIADVFVVNKSELPGSERAVKDLQELAYLSVPRDGWTPRVVPTSAAQRTGISELWQAVEDHESAMRNGPGAEAGRKARAEQELRELLRERIERLAEEELGKEASWKTLLQEVVAKETDPYSAADRAFQELKRRI
ncbi:MAG: methylmalonyl Co-A mutase-associated GTPase MeaB [Euryarchaeota archaeon]|nr:methylmalonyl Co-A mutase-associated GTPase MeaB [Euryarchaeota archaeon]